MTAPGSGAEIIPFLKTWVNLPMAIGFTVLYAKVGTEQQQQQLGASTSSSSISMQPWCSRLLAITSSAAVPCGGAHCDVGGSLWGCLRWHCWGWG